MFVVNEKGSPAVTVKIGNISVDIVPAVRIMEWPQSANGWSTNWLDRKAITKAGACAVAKIHHSGRLNIGLQTNDTVAHCNI